MQFGFVIDQDSCIGCHACTVACKAENDVPVGSFRTWVKSVEVGTFPVVSRSHLVQRCNHCTDAPCVAICPVKALEKRPDGIVDLDRDACIGCRACMQACPYDAIYLNEDRGSVEKCHFCAHRVENALEPACAVVCPVNAIIAGDFDNPSSRVSQVTAEHETKVRRPEQGTGPNVRYKGAADLPLRPGTAARPETYIWSDRPQKKPEPWPISLPLMPEARVVHDTDHKVEWGWPVSLYLVTKGIAGGAALVAPLAAAAGLTGGALAYAPEILALLFTAITCGLLVEDLTRPWAFYRMMTRPNWGSWLVRGAVVLGLFMAAVAGTVVARIAGADAAADGLRWAGAVLGAATAGYTAFLFAQCKGRDLWENRLLLPHLIVQAVMCGTVCLLPFVGWSVDLPLLFSAAAIMHLGFAILERWGGHETDNAKQAAAFLTTIRLGPFLAFRDGLIIGVVVAIALAFLLPHVAFIPALLGLYLYEHAYVRAGQLPPLS